MAKRTARLVRSNAKDTGLFAVGTENVIAINVNVIMGTVVSELYCRVLRGDVLLIFKNYLTPSQVYPFIRFFRSSVCEMIKFESSFFQNKAILKHPLAPRKLINF